MAAHDQSQHFKSPSQSWSMEHSGEMLLQSDLSSGGAGQLPGLAINNLKLN